MEVEFGDDGGRGGAFVAEGFAFYKLLSRRMEHLRRAGAEEGITRSILIEDGYYNWSIYDAGRRLAQVEKATQGRGECESGGGKAGEVFCVYDRKAAGVDLSDSLAGLDPYSFRVTVVLPSWPARFRDAGFRHLVEKTLFLEIPAHVSPTVFWLDHEGMRRFEDAYRLWLVEQASEGIPNTEVLNNFLYELNKLGQ